MARRFRTIFDSKAHTRLILPLFAGLKNPLDYKKNCRRQNDKGAWIYPMSWYMIVKPNLLSFNPNRKAKQPYKNSESEDGEETYQFIILKRKGAKGREEYETNNPAFVQYIVSILDKALPPKPTETRRGEKKVQKAIKAFNKNYQHGPENREYWDGVRNRLFLGVESSYHQALLKVYLPTLREALQKENVVFLEGIAPVFRVYCQELLAQHMIDQSFNDIIHDFLLGVAIFPKKVDLRDVTRLSDQQKRERLALSKFMQICELYKSIVEKGKRQDKLKPSKSQLIAIMCLLREVENVESPFILVPYEE